MPITSRTYRVAPDRLPAMRDKLNEMMEQGVIRRSNSSWSSPLVFVSKPPAADGTPTWQCTVDMRRLNAKTVPKYPTPHRRPVAGGYAELDPDVPDDLERVINGVIYKAHKPARAIATSSRASTS